MNADRKEGTVPFSVERALARLVPTWPEARLCVALSGGVDSVVLVDVLAELRDRRSGLSLRALHVDHGLQAEAEDWAVGCQALCRRLGVTLEVLRLGLSPRAGASVEALAREARYAALAARLAPGEALLTAHHEDDQLETVLLQLLRGAGVAGLAAMPEAAPLGQGLHLRPMLGLSRAALEAHARARGLAWVEDPMNSSERFDRGYLRARVAPALKARWPAVGRTVSRSARHMAEAQGLLDELAALDAAEALDGERLVAGALAALPPARQANLLRWWLSRRGLGAPSSCRLSAILDDLLKAGPDRAPAVRWATGEVRRYRDRLHAMTPLGPAPPADWRQRLEPGVPLELPCDLGSLRLEAAAGGFRLPQGAPRLTVRFRQGAEQLRPAANGRRRTLRNLYQEAGIVPWMRGRIPLLECEGRLLAVGDLWTESDAAAGPGELGWRVVWRGGPAWR